MGNCGCGDAFAKQFTPKLAQKELQRYRASGPGATTKLLRDSLTKTGLAQGTLLDIGTGIGALAFELLDRGVREATVVDASPAYLEVVRLEAARRHRSDAIKVYQGDFVSVASAIPTADLVTLDRVICCYAHYRPVLVEALRHARRGFAFSYPRDRWFVRLGVWFENGLRLLRSSSFRTIVHSPPEMQRIISEGFELKSRSETAMWSIDVDCRRSTAAG
jgi:SAM-dependent methyltransferase